jgi:chromosome segregation ATPase
MSALASEETVVPGPESCRSMLTTSAPFALKVPKDERHADQEVVFAMLKEIFDAEKTRWETRVAGANGIVENAKAEQTEKTGLKDVADAALKAQKEVVHEKLEAQSKAADLIAECEEEVSSAKTFHENAMVTRDGIAKKQETDLGLQETIKCLKEGSIENPKELKKQIASVTALFQSFGAEEALVKTLPQILRRKAEERGGFDEMALKQLDLYMTNHLESLSTQLEASDATVAEHQTAVTAWEAAVQMAEEKKKDSDEALDAASVHQDQLQKELNDARKVLREHTAVVKRKNSDLATEQCGLHSVEGVLEALCFLQEYVTPVLEPEEKPEEVAVEMPVEVEPTNKAKEIDVTMNFDDVPSPTKRTRVSLGGVAPTLLA